jgi:hypothetical protein
MPARRREARRAWLPAEPERGLEKSKTFGALRFRAGGRKFSGRKISLVLSYLSESLFRI